MRQSGSNAKNLGHSYSALVLVEGRPKWESLLHAQREDDFPTHKTNTTKATTALKLSFPFSFCPMILGYFFVLKTRWAQDVFNYPHIRLIYTIGLSLCCSIHSPDKIVFTEQIKSSIDACTIQWCSVIVQEAMTQLSITYRNTRNEKNDNSPADHRCVHFLFKKYSRTH